MKENYNIDIISQVLIDSKSKEIIYSVLNEFIPGYKKIDSGYVGKPDDEYYEFKTEEEMISFYVETLHIEQTFYWNKSENNPDQIMVGANITNDNQIVFSLTFNGTDATVAKYHLRLTEFLNSNISVITGAFPAEYEDGADFKKRYENDSNEIER